MVEIEAHTVAPLQKATDGRKRLCRRIFAISVLLRIYLFAKTITFLEKALFLIKLMRSRSFDSAVYHKNGNFLFLCILFYLCNQICTNAAFLMFLTDC